MVKYANFISSHPNVSQCPTADQPEYAFIGRSNVGKSSLINMLCDRNKLVKTSSTPGKTQLLNFFEINNEFYFVDLPGYGYAKVSKTSRKKWRNMIRNYLLQRENLMLTFVLLDSRIPPQKIDMEFINWLGEMLIPFSIVYTKSDKLKPEELEANIAAIETELLKTWDQLPKTFITSAIKKLGREEILNYVLQINQKF